MSKSNLLRKTPLQTLPLIWKGEPVPGGYYIRNDGTLFRYGKQLSSWKINGRNYALVTIDNHNWTYRLDYMVAYTFLGMRQDAIRLIHVNDDIADDHIDNLVWYRKIDILDKYKDLVIIESDGSIKEEWRTCITEYDPNLGHEVSNLGMIRDKYGNMIPIHENHGYRVFYYLDPNNGKKTRVKSIHRAVAEAFLPNPNRYELVNHLDGNKYNDVVYNLEWATSSMNMEHAYLQNLNKSVRYTSNQIHAVCKLLVQGVQHVHITNMTGVDRKTVSDIYRGRRWKDVSSEYVFPSKKWTPELKDSVANMIISGWKGKEISVAINREYDQSFISLYERLRRELKAVGKI